MKISLISTIWLFVTFTKGECILISLSCGFDVAEEIEILWGSAIFSSFLAFFFSYFFVEKLGGTGYYPGLLVFFIKCTPQTSAISKKTLFCNNNDWRPWWLHDCGLVKIYSMLNFDIILFLTYFKALTHSPLNRP